MFHSTLTVPGRLARERSGLDLLMVVISIGAILRSFRLGAASLWTDELFTATYSRAGIAYLWTEGLRAEPTSPLHYTIIALVEQTFGDSEVALRLPSVVASVLALVVAAALARELFGRSYAALIGTALAAVAPISVYLAQEARPYSFQAASLALALLGLAQFLRTPGSRGPLLVYGSGAILAVYFHTTSIVALAAVNAAVLLSMFGRGRMLDGRAACRWVVAQAVVGSACAPLLPMLLSPNAQAAASWIPAPTRWHLAETIGSTLAGPALNGPPAMAVGQWGALALAALILASLRAESRRAVTVLILVPALFLLLAVGLSLFKPIILPRTLAWLAIPLALYLGAAVARLPRGVSALALSVGLGLCAYNLARIDGIKENWRGFLARLPGLEPPALVVLAPSVNAAAVLRYAPGAGIPVRLEDDRLPMGENVIVPRLLGVGAVTVADLKAAILSARPVWLITRGPQWAWVSTIAADLPPPSETVRDWEGNLRTPAMVALRWNGPKGTARAGD